MSFKEIVTLQIGHYSNYVGTHWWNIQESSFVYDPAKFTGPKEICHDVLFREGLTLQKEVTFTPRLIAFDLKGSLRTLKHDGTLYGCGQDGEEIKWPGDVTMHEEEPLQKNRFLESLEYDNAMEDKSHTEETDDEKAEEVESVTKKKKVDELDPDTAGSTDKADLGGKEMDNMDSSVTVWSDFLRTHYHPKSIQIVEEYIHGDEYRAFDLFSSANETLGSYEATCQWEDKLHHFTEECDHLQGFHVLEDTHDGFGGLGGGLLRYLDDEYSGKGIFTFGFTPADVADATAKDRAVRIINSALAYDKASTHSSLFVPASLAKGLWRAKEEPVNFPNLTYKPVSYHTSAILAASLDTLSLPYRLESGAIGLRDITHSFNSQGRNVATLNTSMPLGLYNNESLVDFFSNHNESFPWQSLTPHMKNSNIPIIQSVVMRGVSDNQVKSQTDISKLPDHMRGVKTRTEVLEKYLAHRCSGTFYAVNCLESPLKTATPFPHIFKNEVNKNGYCSSVARLHDQVVESVPQITSLQCNTEVGVVIKNLHDAAAKMNIKKHHRYLELGLEEDDYIEVLENLDFLAGKYNTESEGL